MKGLRFVGAVDGTKIKARLIGIAAAVACLLGCGRVSSPAAAGLQIVTLTEAELTQMDQRTEREALDLLSNLTSPDDDTQYHAQNKLLALRPLPAAAIEKLRQLLKAPMPSTRQRAAAILVLHQRDNQRNLAAVEQALTTEQDKETKALFTRAAPYLRLPSLTPAVLSDSPELDKLIAQAVMAIVKPAGREVIALDSRSLYSIQLGTIEAAGREARLLDRTSHAERGAKPVVTGNIGPLTVDLPETVLLESADTPAKVTLGWKWDITFRDEKPQDSGNQMNYSTANRTLERAPVGALLQIRQPLRLGKSTIPAGTILLQTTFGWSTLSPEAAVEHLQSRLTIKEPLQEGYPDVRETAAVGAAAFGPAAKGLMAALTSVDDLSVRYRAIALMRIGDKSALPTLREWRKKHEGWGGITEVLDKAITALEK